MTTYSEVRNSNNTTPFGGEQDVYRVAQMLRRATPIICADRFGMVAPMPKKSTDTARFRRVKNIINPKTFGKTGGTGADTLAKFQLTEGSSTSNSFTLQYESVQVSLSQYGIWTSITDKSDDLNQNDVINDAIDVVGDTMAEIKELHTWGTLSAGLTNVRYAGGVANDAAITSSIVLSDIRAASRTLMRNKAKMITSILDGSIKVGTKPVESAYVALGHTDLLPDIRKLGGFTPVAEYGSMKPTCQQEVGAVENVRFVLSPYFSPGASEAFGDTGALLGAADGTDTSFLNDWGDPAGSGTTKADIYSLIVMGADAFGTVVLRGMNAAKILTRMPNTPAKGDELGQEGSVGAKTYFAAKILNDQWMVQIRCFATRNPT
jgi:N4-gp56 family major capsid protein